MEIIRLIGVVGTGQAVSAERVAAELAVIGPDADIEALIHSPGGEAQEGFTIFNLFAEHKGKVTAKVLGLAASVASVIAMAADEIVMMPGSELFLHRSWTPEGGNADELRANADSLETLDERLVEIYQRHAKLTEGEIRFLLHEETTLTAEQAVEHGFATRIAEDPLSGPLNLFKRTRQVVPLPLARYFEPKAEKPKGDGMDNHDPPENNPDKKPDGDAPEDTPEDTTEDTSDGNALARAFKTLASFDFSAILPTKKADEAADKAAEIEAARVDKAHARADSRLVSLGVDGMPPAKASELRTLACEIEVAGIKGVALDTFYAQAERSAQAYRKGGLFEESLDDEGAKGVTAAKTDGINPDLLKRHNISDERLAELRKNYPGSFKETS